MLSFLSFFLDPHCPAGIKNAQYAKWVNDSLQTLTLLVSLSYDFEAVRAFTKNSGFENKMIYILPAGRYTDRMVLKQWLFIKDFCYECDKKFQGDLIHAKGLIIDKEETKIVFKLDYTDLKKEFE